MTIKCSPDDFVVDEQLDPDWRARVADRPAPYVVYRLSKSTLATAEATAQVARQLRVPPAVVAVAGLKDKYARTTQHITVEARNPHHARALPASQHGAHWRIERLGWVDEPISPEAIVGNRFRLVVRDLTRRQCQTMDQAIGLMTLAPPAPRAEAGAAQDVAGEGAADAPPAAARAPDAPSPGGLTPATLSRKGRGDQTLRFVNYFGDQRFGSARHGQGFVARPLLRGDFEQALRLSIATAYHREKRAGRDFKQAVARHWGRWQELLPMPPSCPERLAIERLAQSPTDFRGAFTSLPYLFQQLCVYAYQSHLWNTIARQLVDQRCGNADQATVMIEADDPFGAMLFPCAAAVPTDLAELNLPVLGRNTELVDPWKSVAEAVLKEEEIASLRDLKIPGVHRPFFGEADRRLFVDATEFTITAPEADPTATGEPRLCRVLSFVLPRGAYATVLLRALGQ